MHYTLSHAEQADYDAGGARLDAVRRTYRATLLARYRTEISIEVYDETDTYLLDSLWVGRDLPTEDDLLGE